MRRVPPVAAWLTFAAVMLFTLVLLCATLVVLMANTLLRPPRMTDARATWVMKRVSPADVGLRNFENVHFEVRDERTGKPLRLAGWWIPAAAPNTRRTILLIHGYADAKVGGIAWAPLLHALGWHLLAIDLRAHGESGGVHSTAGFFERHDVAQVLNLFRAQRPRETETVAIFGISLGAAVATAVAAMRDDVAGIILESPFGDYRRAVTAHGRMRGLPEGIIRDLAVRLAEWISGADFRAVRPELLIKQVPCPVMLIHAGDDPFVPDDDATALAEAFKSRGNDRDRYWSVACAGHVLCMAVEYDDYHRRIGEFLDGVSSPRVRDAVAAT
jgi:pimeloyl-ACP methyl ester carboxylesterase